MKKKQQQQPNIHKHTHTLIHSFGNKINTEIFGNLVKAEKSDSHTKQTQYLTECEGKMYVYKKNMPYTKCTLAAVTTAIAAWSISFTKKEHAFNQYV